MRVLLDTIALYAAVGQSDVPFTPKAQRLLADPETICLLSSVSISEIAIKAEKKLTSVTRKLLEQAVTAFDLTPLPFAASHAYRLFGLPAHHRDPFDRMLIATALSEDVPVVTSDPQFRKYGVRVIW